MTTAVCSRPGPISMAHGTAQTVLPMVRDACSRALAAETLTPTLTALRQLVLMRTPVYFDTDHSALGSALTIRAEDYERLRALVDIRAHGPYFAYLGVFARTRSGLAMHERDEADAFRELESLHARLWARLTQMSYTIATTAICNSPCADTCALERVAESILAS